MKRIQFSIKYRPEIESGRYNVETRSGRPVRIICWDAVGDIYKLVALWSDEKGFEFPEVYTEDGVPCCEDTELDLFLVEIERPTNTIAVPVWRKACAGTGFKEDVVILPIGEDKDARLVRCAVNDCFYITVRDLKKLPFVEDAQKPVEKMRHDEFDIVDVRNDNKPPVTMRKCKRCVHYNGRCPLDDLEPCRYKPKNGIADAISKVFKPKSR